MAGITRMFDKQPLSLKGGKEASGVIATQRPEHETHLTARPDRVGKYLLKSMKEFTFDEFSQEFLKKMNLVKEFSGVPIPLRDEDREAFKTPQGLNGNIIAENMARVLGIDPQFKYRDSYTSFIGINYGQKGVDNLTRKAKDHGESGNLEEACIYFRAALVLKYNDLAAMFGYSRSLREMYAKSKKEDYIGNLKAEAFDYLEMVTEFYPRFDMGWYYLGYMYLNLGLYIKAKLAWDEYLRFGRMQKDRKEIQRRIEQIKEPIQIEKGYNAVLAGRWKKGLGILEPYKESQFRDWWPLWYYLGVAYARTGKSGEAENAFKRALKGSPRHIESLEELVELYEKKGARAEVKKYRDKLALVKK
ncbi:MAG: tetratricopeptide repeat protein [Clostridiales bacterium]|nr:tetratricopeptide repeat protein [Clostridiales bacterium]